MWNTEISYFKLHIFKETTIKEENKIDSVCRIILEYARYLHEM